MYELIKLLKSNGISISSSIARGAESGPYTQHISESKVYINCSNSAEMVNISDKVFNVFKLNGLPTYKINSSYCPSTKTFCVSIIGVDDRHFIKDYF